jgi:glycosyltransferase involved in cell wall biosynthesis
MTLGIVYHMPCWRAADGSLREIEGSFARYVDSLAPYFDEIVLCVPLIACQPGGTRVRSRNVTVHELPAFDGPLRFYLRLPAALPRLYTFARRIDILHCRVPTPAAIFAFMCARLFARPSFLLVVGDLAALSGAMRYRGVKQMLWRAYVRFEEWGVQWMVDRSLAFANGAALAGKHSRPGRQVVQTQTTTIDAADIVSADDRCGSRPFTILTVSRIDPRKGLSVLPHLLRALADRGLETRLDIVGPVVGAPGEAERREIEASAAALGVRERIRLVGAVPLEDLMPRYRDYDAFVLPTGPGEGVPRVLLEAMASGVPVVTTAVAGITSLVKHEENGLLVARPIVEELAHAIVRLRDDRPLRRSLIEGGRATARTFTRSAQAAAMMAEVSSRLGVQLRAGTTGAAPVSVEQWS